MDDWQLCRDNGSNCGRKVLPGLLVLAVTVVLAACGGGGGSSGGAAPANPPPTNPPPPPFGLTQRESLAPLDVIVGGSQLGTIELQARFPGLSFSGALFLTAVPGELRLVVLEQSGRMRVFDDDPGVSSATTVLDLSGRVLNGGEEGLLGLAFDPGFAQNRFIYVHYSAGSPRRSVISRFTWNAASDLVEVASEKVLLEVEQPFSNHNGGMLAFGPDDYLYIAFGDGGGGGDPHNNAQDPGNLLGSLLRVDVHPANPGDPYDIPADNPFVSDPQVLDEIWAYGLRNPFRFSFDRANGDLWLGDVGQSSFEEINLVRAGDNLGWRVFEGNADFDGSANTLPDSAFTPPVLTYGRSDGIAVIGGYVYRGNRLPSLVGRYLYSDFGSGRIWALEWNGTSVVSNDLLTNASSPTSFGEGADGEVYVVSRNSGIFRFNETVGGGNIPDLLSETGAFTDLANLIPASGLIEYDLNHPFWSDGAEKRRWIGLPNGTTLNFSALGNWQYPVGTVLIKHFDMPINEGTGEVRRLETRFLVLTSGNGWQGVTYRWNTQQTDAELISSRETETLTITEAGGGTRSQTYEYPSRTDCLRCHTDVAGGALGVKTAQLNRDFDYSGVVDNQLRSWNNIVLFASNIGDAALYTQFASLEDSGRSVAERARTYLNVNCAQCHQPGGSTPSDMDLRLATSDSGTNTIGVAPSSGDLGITNAAIISPGDRTTSVLWERMRRTDTERMPPLSSHRVDEAAVDLIGQWIDTL